MTPGEYMAAWWAEAHAHPRLLVLVLVGVRAVAREVRYWLGRPIDAGDVDSPTP